ncbi:serine hydrolase domain-containing protein [Patulibacter defluvii]|uniref:serine hydrolase domain-containing protein n=1 Tax=Patulibacter defluvii TaxID=3095358 RepID=UPI002A74A3EF|nr:serine hydrolase [Patulibacter sp. DM4]
MDGARKRARTRGRSTTALLATAALLALGGAVTAAPAAAATATEKKCATGPAGTELPDASATALGFDAPALQAAVDRSASSSGGSVAVYRYGCRVASAYSESPNKPYQSWSAAKSVVSMAAGRAIQLGLLSPDDRVGSLVPEADAAHGAITVRQLLTQSSGLHQHVLRDFNFILDDHLQNALTLPFDYAPGTHYIYGQVTVSLLAEVVGRAAGMDFQDFLHRELLSKVGIPRDLVAIHRDRAGRTDGYFGIEMATRNWARLGQLLLQDGVWNGHRLLDVDWMHDVQRGNPVNDCYSLLFWPDSPGCAPRWAPPDGYEMNGLGEQIVWVVPSESLVVVRFGPMTSGNSGALKEGVTKAIRKPRPVPQRPVEKKAGVQAASQVEEGFLTILNLPDLLAVTQILLPPLPAAGPERARVAQLPERELRPDAAGDLPVRVTCPPVARRPCRGTLRALAASGDATLASGRFEIGAGQARTVVLGSAGLDAAIAGGRVRLRTTSEDALDGATTTRLVVVPGRAAPARAAVRVSGVRLTARRLRLRVSRPATVRATIERRSGRRWRTAARATVRARRAGTASARVRRLAAGRYRVRLSARTADGATSARRVAARVR